MQTSGKNSVANRKGAGVNQSLRCFYSFILMTLMLALLLIIFLYSLMVGPISFSAPQVMDYFSGHGTDIQNIILSQIRIPRTLTAIAAGAGLSIAGLLLQSVTRNPISCPTLIGVSNGSALVSLILLIWLPTVNLNVYFLLTLAGGVITFMLTYLFAFTQKNLSMSRLVLVGTTINGLFYGVSYLLLTSFPERAQDLLFVLNGSIAATQTKSSYYLMTITSACFLVVWGGRNYLNILGSTDDTLKSIGLSPEKLSFFFIFIAILLSSSVVGITGPVAFFGLIAPCFVRTVMPGALPGQRIVCCAILGALLMLLTDVFIRKYFGGEEISIGIIFAFLSIPCLIILLRVVKL